ncbi:MAG: histidinol-phosphatase HisJ family protein [Clostridia bacterium]|nr:histidinol-phosphatase HisJ family protein [Clostridia bacterium]
MKLFNNHTHTEFSHDGTGSIDKISVCAVNQNLFGFAVTDHCDCEYINAPAVKALLNKSYNSAKYAKKKYNEQLIISCGVEIGEAIFDLSVAENIISSYNWDVVLGSVHAVRLDKYEMPFSTIDFSTFTDKQIQKYVDAYFADVLDTAIQCDYDVLCHLSVILRYVTYKYNRFVDMSRYDRTIEKILKTVIERDKTLEINTSGIDKGYLMPDEKIIEVYKSLGGKRITLGSDSHAPDSISNGLEEGVNVIKKYGFDKLTYYIDRKPIEYSII